MPVVNYQAPNYSDDERQRRRQEAESILSGYARQYNAPVQSGDVDSLLDRANYDQFAGNVGAAARDFEDQYKRRGSSQQTGSGQDSTDAGRAGVGNYSAGAGPFTPPPSTPPPSTPPPNAAGAGPAEPAYQFGAERDTYLIDLYKKFFNRTPSPEELQSHLQNPAQDWGRTVLGSFQQSPEWREQSGPGAISGLYQQHLGRTPGEAEIASHLNNPYGLEGVTHAILTSDEYKSRSQGAPTPAPTPQPTPAPGPTPGPTPNETPPPGPFNGAGPDTTKHIPDLRTHFDDPTQAFPTNYALDRFLQRTNPSPNSATAMYEQFAKEFATLLQGDVFSDQEEAALRTQAFDRLERNKQQEMRQKQEELGRRRIPPSSGVYISEMNRIRDKWDGLKAQNENQLLTSAIGERQRRLTQSFSVLGSLMAAEEGRLDAAMALSMIPLQIQQQAFSNNISAANLGGNPAAMTSQLLSLLQIATQQGMWNDQQQNGAWEALGEWIGGLF